MTTAPARRAQLAVQISSAARIVPPVWPLEQFVAVNPLLGLLDEGFQPAIAEARRWLGARGYPGATTRAPGGRTVCERLDPTRAIGVDRLVGRWCGLLIDPHRTVGGDGNPYARWRDLAGRDRELRRLADARLLASQMEALPGRADDAVLAALDLLGVDEPIEELRGQLARLPGWAGYARWCDEWAGPHDPAPRLRLVELLAIRLATETVLAADEPPTRPGPAERVHIEQGGAPPAQGVETLAEAETAYRATLLANLLRHTGRELPAPAAAQIVCCIDVRSEPLRRHLEGVGPYQTFGFAGFFAAPLRFRPFDADESYPSAPVLLHPDLEVAELDGQSDRGPVAARATIDHASHTNLSMFATAEAAGWALGPAAAVRTFAPRTRSMPSPSRAAVDLSGIPIDEGATMVEAALRTMGLTSGWTPLVVLCGHGSTTTANPHAASLECGACGGNNGGPNARALAALANHPDVRAELRERDLHVPDGTWFVAAEHNTTTDEITFLDAHLLPPSHGDVLRRLAVDTATAGERVATERLGRLDDTRRGKAKARARARAADWAQTRPEWGLARNAAFIAAPRALTEGVDLDGRVFLHSYDPNHDNDGTALETILTAPMVVAHWINAQYYFSTVDPEVYGAGDKALHNPVAGIGVVAGDGHDLCIGLPWQSVASPDGPYHEPLRLLTVLQAPIDRIDAVIARNPILRQLFDGEWVHLVAVPDPDDGAWWQRLPGGTWEEQTSPEVMEVLA